MKKSITQEQLNFLERIVTEYSDALTKYGRRFVSYKTSYYPLVEDAVQITFEKATRYVALLMKHENVIGWLKKSCYFSLLHEIDRYRKQADREALYADVDTAKDTNRLLIRQAIERWEKGVTLDEVLAAVQEILTDEELEVFHSHFLSDETIAETAKTVGITFGMTRGKIKKIQEKLTNYFFLLCIFLFLMDYKR